MMFIYEKCINNLGLSKSNIYIDYIYIIIIVIFVQNINFLKYYFSNNTKKLIKQNTRYFLL